jgi:hypothetical protein
MIYLNKQSNSEILIYSHGGITAGIKFAIILGKLLGHGVTRQASFSPGAAQYKKTFAVQ